MQQCNHRLKYKPAKKVKNLLYLWYLNTGIIPKGLCYQRRMEIRNVHVTRYVTPLREGGSMPAIAEADDGFLYVLKFRGAGQGRKALIAEFIGGELARAAGLRMPEVVFAELDEAFGRTEGDEEIQDLLKASVGLNLGVHYLSGSITYDPVVDKVDSLLASKIVWLDSLITNVDRTARNANMLMWNKELWLIDHGASLYFHHAWSNWEAHAQQAFSQIKDHVLLPFANHLEEADSEMRLLITPEVIELIVGSIPNVWLEPETEAETTDSMRAVYHHYLTKRLSRNFITEAKHAKQASI